MFMKATIHLHRARFQSISTLVTNKVFVYTQLKMSCTEISEAYRSSFSRLYNNISTAHIHIPLSSLSSCLLAEETHSLSPAHSCLLLCQLCLLPGVDWPLNSLRNFLVGHCHAREVQEKNPFLQARQLESQLIQLTLTSTKRPRAASIQASKKPPDSQLQIGQTGPLFAGELADPVTQKKSWFSLLCFPLPQGASKWLAVTFLNSTQAGFFRLLCIPEDLLKRAEQGSQVPTRFQGVISCPWQKSSRGKQAPLHVTLHLLPQNWGYHCATLAVQ